MINKLKNFLKGKDERNLLVNIFLAFLIKGFSLIVSFFSMPLYIKYFDNESVLGVWYTILSLLSWILICDLGLGNGLRNKFLDAFLKKDYEKGKKLISSTYFAMIFIAIIALFLGAILIYTIDLNTFFNISENILDSKILRWSIIILYAGIIVNFVLKIVNSIIYSIQKAAINNIITLISSILPLLFILLIPRGNDISINFFLLSIIHVFSINVPLIIATIFIFLFTCKHYKPGIKYIEKNTVKDMLVIGMKFFTAQIFFMLLMSTNEVFITRLFGPDLVVDYNIYYKLFMTVGSLFMLALSPLWSQVTKYYSEKRIDKIIKTNKLLLLISFAAIFAEFLMIIILQPIINIWLADNAIVVNYFYAFVFAMFGGVYILNIVLTTVANGIGELKTQVLFYGVGSFLKLPILLILKNIFNDWILIVLYNCIILIVFCAFQYVFINRCLKKEENKNGIIYK